MNTNSTKLSLELPPELRFELPRLARAKVYSTVTQLEHAKRNYERAARRLEDRLRREEEERQWLRRQEEEKLRKQAMCEKARTREWFNRLFHQTWEYREEPMPAHSSQKGWRRLLSECPDLCESGRYGMWGCAAGTVEHSRRNRGRKPRKPWFKKTRAQH